MKETKFKLNNIEIMAEKASTWIMEGSKESEIKRLISNTGMFSQQQVIGLATYVISSFCNYYYSFDIELAMKPQLRRYFLTCLNNELKEIDGENLKITEVNEIETLDDTIHNEERSESESKIAPTGIAERSNTYQGTDCNASSSNEVKTITDKAEIEAQLEEFRVSMAWERHVDYVNGSILRICKVYNNPYKNLVERTKRLTEEDKKSFDEYMKGEEESFNKFVKALIKEMIIKLPEAEKKLEQRIKKKQLKRNV